MRLLLLITDLEIGGTPTVVRELALRLRDENTHVEVVCLKGWGPTAAQLEQAGVSTKALAATTLMDLPAMISEVRSIVRDGQFDTVLSFLVHANAVAALASRKLPGVRWLQSIQTTQLSPRWHWWLQRIAQHAAVKVIVPSPSVAEVARDRADVPPDKIVVIPNAVDVPTTAVTRSGDGKRVVFIGRLDAVKRVPDLIAAVAQLPAEYTLHIYGEGVERKTIEQAIASRGIHDRVTLHGAIRGSATALAEADVLVLPSQAEGFGLVLIEAMAAGVPVVATNVPGICDVVRDGETGILVAAGDVAGMARAIERVCEERSLRSRLTAGGRGDVAARFGWGHAIALYREALGMSSMTIREAL